MTYSFRTNGNFIDFVHTDNTNQAVESVLRSLHNTSRCVTWSLPEGTDRISFVVDDIRVDNFLLAEIDFDGVAIDSQDDFETGIIAAFSGLANNPGGGTSYLVYKAYLTQTGTSDPQVVQILENTIGDIVWTRFNGSSYIGTLANAFPSQLKTVIPPFGGAIQGASPIMIPCGGINGSNPNQYYYGICRLGTGQIEIYFNDQDFEDVEWSTALSAFGEDCPLYVEIQVWP